jgi:hypothetical protein
MYFLKTFICLLWAMLFTSNVFAQSPDFQRFSNRQNPQKPELVWVKLGENANLLEAYYQSPDNKGKVKLTVLGKRTTETEEVLIQVKNPTTGKVFEMTEVWAMTGAIYENGIARYFEMEAIYAFKTEKIYIDYPPMVSRVFYSSASSPTPQALQNCTCEQADGEATWLCVGTIPGSGNAIKIKYEANLGKITFTSPRGTKIYRKIE